MHLAAEFTTVLALIVDGWGLLKLKAWGEQLYLLTNGALIYSMTQSPGYFLQTCEPGFVVMFAVLIILALFILVKLLREACRRAVTIPGERSESGGLQKLQIKKGIKLIDRALSMLI